MIDKLSLTCTDFYVNDDSGFTLEKTEKLSENNLENEKYVLPVKLRSGKMICHKANKAYLNTEFYQITCKSVKVRDNDFRPICIIQLNPNKVANQTNTIDAVPEHLDEIFKGLKSDLEKLNLNFTNLMVKGFDIGTVNKMNTHTYQYIKMFMNSKRNRSLKARTFKQQTGMIVNSSQRTIMYNKHEQIKDLIRLNKENNRQLLNMIDPNTLRFETSYRKSYYATKLKVRSFEDFKENWRKVALYGYDQLLKIVLNMSNDQKVEISSQQLLNRIVELKNNGGRYKTKFLEELGSFLIDEIMGKENFIDTLTELKLHRQSISDLKKSFDTNIYLRTDVEKPKELKKELYENLLEKKGQL